MSQLFDIQKFTEADLDILAAKPSDPHVHDSEELIVGIHGVLDHFIDFKTSVFESPYISFITKGKLHLAKPAPKNRHLNLWLINFQSEFIPETTFQLYSWYHDYATLEFERGACFDRMDQLCAMMFEESRQETPDFSVIRHLLSALFTMIEA